MNQENRELKSKYKNEDDGRNWLWDPTLAPSGWLTKLIKIIFVCLS